MLTLVINLATAVERRARMDEVLGRMGLPYVLQTAIAGDALSDEQRARFVHHADMTLSDNELACTLSHVEAWRSLLASEAPAALILEDDVAFSDGFMPLLEGLAIDDNEVCLFHLETSRIPVDLALKPAQRVGRYGLHRQRSRDQGSACYVINRKTAAFLIEHYPRMRRAIDLELFSPGRRNIPEFASFQAVPAPAVQLIRQLGESPDPLRRSSVQGYPHPPRPGDQGLVNRTKRFLRPAYYLLLTPWLAARGVRRLVAPFR